MRIKSVAVLGAGAVGSYIIWGLSNRKDIKLGVIAEGERKERLEKNGCLIKKCIIQKCGLQAKLMELTF